MFCRFLILGMCWRLKYSNSSIRWSTGQAPGNQCWCYCTVCRALGELWNWLNVRLRQGIPLPKLFCTVPDEVRCKIQLKCSVCRSCMKEHIEVGAARGPFWPNPQSFTGISQGPAVANWRESCAQGCANEKTTHPPF